MKKKSKLMIPSKVSWGFGLRLTQDRSLVEGHYMKWG